MFLRNSLRFLWIFKARATRASVEGTGVDAVWVPAVAGSLSAGVEEDAAEAGAVVTGVGAALVDADQLAVDCVAGWFAGVEAWAGLIAVGCWTGCWRGFCIGGKGGTVLAESSLALCSS